MLFIDQNPDLGDPAVIANYMYRALTMEEKSDWQLKCQAEYFVFWRSE